MKEKRWFKDLKKTRKKFNNIENAIEAFKFKYERENHLVEWILGTGIALILSLSIVDVLKNPIIWIAITGLVLYIVIFIAIFSLIIMYIIKHHRQKKAVGYLYREKDKEENKKKK